MIHLNHTIDILIGGAYTGNNSWNKKRSDIDNCFKIYHLTEGELYLYDNNQTYFLNEGGLYFINGSKLVTQSCKTSFSVYWLHFIPKELILHHSLLSVPLVVQLSNKLLNNITNPMVEISRLITNQYQSHRDYCLNTLRTQTFIQSVIVELSEIYLLNFAENPYNIQLIEPAIVYIKDNYARIIHLNELAELCCMSPNYFHKIFTQTLNITPINYILLLRMNAALSMLLNNNINSKEVAYQLGFCNDAYFSRVFKNYYGITPGVYRKSKGLLF